MSDSEDLNEVANLAVGNLGEDDSDSIEFLDPSTTASTSELRPSSPSPPPGPNSEVLRRSAPLSPELGPRAESPRLVTGNSPRSSPRLDSPRLETRWRSSSTMQASGTLREGGKAASSANEVLMGARRTKEVLQLSEETAALTRENAELKQLVRKLVARDEKAKLARKQDLERVKGVLAANQAKTIQAVAQAEQGEELAPLQTFFSREKTRCGRIR